MTDVSALEKAQLLERVSEEATWAVLGLDAAVKGRVIVQAVGDGSLDDLTSQLKDDQVCCAPLYDVTWGFIDVGGVHSVCACVRETVFTTWHRPEVAELACRVSASEASTVCIHPGKCGPCCGGFFPFVSF